MPKEALSNSMTVEEAIADTSEGSTAVYCLGDKGDGAILFACVGDDREAIAEMITGFLDNIYSGLNVPADDDTVDTLH